MNRIFSIAKIQAEDKTDITSLLKSAYKNLLYD